MKQIEKIPRDNRLRRAGAKGSTPCLLHLYRLYLDTYLYNMAELAGNDRILTDVLKGFLPPYLSQYQEMPCLVEFVAESRDLPRRELGELLYQVLVRPVAEIEEGRHEA